MTISLQNKLVIRETGTRVTVASMRAIEGVAMSSAAEIIGLPIMTVERKN